MARARRRRARSARSSNVSPDVRYPVLGATLPAARRDRPPRERRVGLRPRRRRARRRPDPGLRGDRDRGRRAAAPSRSRPRAGRIAAGQGRARRRRAQLGARRDWPALRLPIQSHPLQALVSELYEQVLDTVVMSNAVHVYVSQAHKGELVMGAGIDAYNSYAQRGSFHVIEHQLAAALELFPIFARARVLRTWAGIVDVCPDASPIVGLTPVDGPVRQLRLGHGRLQGDARAPGWTFAWTIAHGEPHELNAPFSLDRFTTGALIDEHGAAGGGALMLLIRCPWCGERDEVEFSLRRPGGHRLPGRPGGALRRGVGRVAVRPRQPEGALRGAVGAHAGLPALVRRRPRHGHARDRPMRFTLRRRRVRGAPGRDAGGRARPERRARRLPQHLPRPAARRLLGRRGGAERARPDRRARPMVRATLVELEDGLERRAAGRQGPARRAVRAGALRHAATRTATLLVVGGGRSGVAAAAAGAGRTHPRATPARAASSPRRRPAGARRGRPPSGSTTATTCSRSSAAGALWHIRARRIVLATGAIERPLVFAEQRPARDHAAPAPHAGTSSAARGSSCSRTTTPRSGSPGATVVDSRQGRLVVDTIGEDRLEGVVLDDGSTAAVRRAAPSRAAGARAVHLWSQARGRLRCDERIGGVRPGRRARPESRSSGRRPAPACPTSQPLWLVPGDEDASFVDLERDSTVADVRRAVGAGLRSVEHVKRYTTIGTGSDQGKTAERERDRRRRRAARRHRRPSSARPPSARRTSRSPSRCSPAATAARCSTRCASTPIHPWHVAHGAVFENVGQWKRPRYYPRGGESMDEAVLRECAAARERVGDRWTPRRSARSTSRAPTRPSSSTASTRTRFDSLAVGTCRYGVMCKPDGMVFDDGVVMRVGERALPLHDDDRQRGAGARLDGGVAPDRVARAARLADVGHRAVGDGRRRRAGLARPARRG